jgi:hypothetical protein
MLIQHSFDQQMSMTVAWFTFATHQGHSRGIQVALDEFDPLQKKRVFGHLVVESPAGLVVVIGAVGSAAKPVTQENVLESVLRQVRSKAFPTELGGKAGGRVRTHVYDSFDPMRFDEGREVIEGVGGVAD